ncbi:MAG: virulence RhuM family protein, partial [Deltaproteobacteria bacterium]|nr:virulence RhuM family protein [Deltaproteobacteria bacterium]
VEQYLAFAETMAQQQTSMYMKDWIERLDAIVRLNGRELLTHAGEINHQQALKKSGREYEQYKFIHKNEEKELNLNEIEQDIKRLKE